jgi:hypothetical protein
MTKKLFQQFGLGLTLCTLSSGAIAQDYLDGGVVRIEVGQQRGGYSREELERRVWQLERAVWQLQQRVFELETKPVADKPESWICTVRAMGATHTGVAATKAEAMQKALSACKKETTDNGFFCKNPSCEK